jgi:hypothetical protein
VSAHLCRCPDCLAVRKEVQAELDDLRERHALLLGLNAQLRDAVKVLLPWLALSRPAIALATERVLAATRLDAPTSITHDEENPCEY